VRGGVVDLGASELLGASVLPPVQAPTSTATTATISAIGASSR
jgi:hypothetical protein